jgi:hypothetical protein
VSFPSTEHVLCTKRRTTRLPKGFPSQQTPKTTPEKKNRPKAARTFLRQPRRQKNKRYYNLPQLIPDAAAEETTIKSKTQDSDHFVEKETSTREGDQKTTTTTSATATALHTSRPSAHLHANPTLKNLSSVFLNGYYLFEVNPSSLCS